MVSENYKKIESKAFWYLERYASSSKNLRDYLRKKVRDTELNQDSEVIINQIITNLEISLNDDIIRIALRNKPNFIKITKLYKR